MDRYPATLLNKYFCRSLVVRQERSSVHELYADSFGQAPAQGNLVTPVLDENRPSIRHMALHMDDVADLNTQLRQASPQMVTHGDFQNPNQRALGYAMER